MSPLLFRQVFNIRVFVKRKMGKGYLNHKPFEVYCESLKRTLTVSRSSYCCVEIYICQRNSFMSLNKFPFVVDESFLSTKIFFKYLHSSIFKDVDRKCEISD